MSRRFGSIFPGALALSLALSVGTPGLLTASAETYEGVAPVTSDETDAETAGTADGEAWDGELPPVLKGDTEIEQQTNSYKAAKAQAEAAEVEIEKLQQSIDEIDAALPKQQALSDEGIKQRYIMQSNPLAVVEPLLSSQSLDDFLKQVDYLEKVSRSNLLAFNTLCNMKEDAERTRAEQDALREEAEGRLEDAQATLSSTQDERTWQQELAQSMAIRQADELGGEASIKKDDEESVDAVEDDAEINDPETESTANADEGADSPSGGTSGADSADGEEEEDREPVTQDTSAIPDGADWRSDRDEFIAEWAPRIDAYLAGSPLAGQGANFAAAAWKYNVDPRWSPAISNTESSKGRYCIRPHNAWGWGAADSDPYGLASEWESWEDAIDAHVAGLAHGYGYTISIANAQKYCSSWRGWYNNTLGQMALI